MFTKAHHQTLSWASWIQFTPMIPLSLKSILMLSSHLCLGYPSGLLPLGLPTKSCKHLMFLNLITLTILGEEYRIWSSSSCNFLRDLSSFLLGPNIILYTLFSKNLSLCFSLKVGDQVLHPYKTTGKITVLYILILSFFFYMRQEGKRFWTE
jgi:hypothetical protein